MTYALDSFGSLIENPEEENYCHNTGKLPIIGSGLQGKRETISRKVEILASNFISAPYTGDNVDSPPNPKPSHAEKMILFCGSKLWKGFC